MTSTTRHAFKQTLLLFLALAIVHVSGATTTSAGMTRAASAAIVDLGFAQYQGISVTDTVTNAINTNFLGVRYGGAPTGVNRFAAPQPPLATPGVQMANSQPNLCFAASGGGRQPKSPFRMASRAADAATPVSDEDCLFLNVYVPGNFSEPQDLAVVFWIHGGGYVGGHASGYNGNDLIRESGGNVVVVVVQYRVGLFGFLAGQKVQDGGALNAGLLDQQFALEFVQQHIAKFGGDSTRVTIWGESAGAGSVLQHVVANGGRTDPPLFRAAITSSTFLPSQYNFNDLIPETLYSEVVSQTKCSSSLDTLACLRSADATVLQNANLAIIDNGFRGTFSFVPVVDGTFITDRPTQLLKQGNLNGEVLYSVTNTFEGNNFVNQSATDTVSDYIAQLFPNFGSTEIADAAARYAGLGTTLFQKNSIFGESIIICPTYYMLSAFGDFAFKGEFAIPPGLHGDDLPYYFPSSYANGQPFSNSQFDQAFPQSFLNFVTTLDPNAKFGQSDTTPFFQFWEGSNEILFNRTAAGEPDIRPITTSSALLERCSFWNSVSALTSQ